MTREMARLGKAIREWSATFVDPCFTDKTRAAIGTELVAACGAAPGPAAAVLAAVVHDLADSLAEVDPWRSQTSDSFGNVDDHTDMVPEFDDWVLGPVRPGLAPAASEIVVAAFDREGLELLLRPRLDEDAAAAVVDVDSALRWLVFRRLAFRGSDIWVLESAEYWTHRLELAAHQLDRVDPIYVRQRARSRIDDADYDPDRRHEELFRPYTEEEICQIMKTNS
jgi:hypothetical protein